MKIRLDPFSLPKLAVSFCQSPKRFIQNAKLVIFIFYVGRVVEETG